MTRTMLERQIAFAEKAGDQELLKILREALDNLS